MESYTHRWDKVNLADRKLTCASEFVSHLGKSCGDPLRIRLECCCFFEELGGLKPLLITNVALG